MLDSKLDEMRPLADADIKEFSKKVDEYVDLKFPGLDVHEARDLKARMKTYHLTLVNTQVRSACRDKASWQECYDYLVNASYGLPVR